MDAKTRAWQKLQAELKSPEPPDEQPDPKKETLLQRFQRMAKQPIAKPETAPEPA
jgi:hypothetical protein